MSPATQAFFLRFTTTGALQALELLAPEAEPPADDRAARLYAASTLQEAVGRQPTTYLSLLADRDRDTGWNMLALRIPSNDSRSVDLLLARKERCLLIIGARGTSSAKYVHELEVTPRLHVGVDSATPISPDLLGRLGNLPTREEREAEVDARLERWIRYLEVEQRHAEAQRFAVSYTALHRHNNPGRIRVEIDPKAPRHLLGRVAECSRGDRLHLTRLDEGPDDEGRGGRRLASGEFHSYDPKSRRLTLELEDDAADSFRAGRLQLPEEGLVVNDAAGSLAMIRRQQNGIKRLKLHGGANPSLDRILFGDNDDLPLPSFGPVDPVPLDECLNPSQINEHQRLAVALALHTPDCLFLQGPPGTGKTTVIAELCYQLARRGQRILVASQANLAVDNALSRLQQSREILAVRLGPSDKVEDDAQEFVGDRAVQRWLRSVKEHSQARVTMLRRQFDAKIWFDEHGETLMAWARDAASLEAERQAFLKTAQAKQKEAESDDAQMARHAETADRARQLAEALGGADPVSSDVAALWADSTTSGPFNTWTNAVEGVRFELGSTADTPWELSDTLIEQRRLLASNCEFDMAVTEALQFVAAHNADLDHLRIASTALRDTEQKHERAAQIAKMAQTDAQIAEHESRQRKERVVAFMLTHNVEDPVLAEEWSDRPGSSPTTDALASRLHRVEMMLTIPGGHEKTPRSPHPDPARLITSWVRFERDGRGDDAERALSAIEAATAKLSDRATHPLWRFFTRAAFDRHLEHLRKERAALIRDLGTKTVRSGVSEMVYRERKDYLRRIWEAAEQHKARAAQLHRAAEEASAEARYWKAEHDTATVTFDQCSENLRSLLRRLRDEHGAATGTARALAELLETGQEVEDAFGRAVNLLRDARASRERRRSRLEHHAQTLDTAKKQAARDFAELAQDAESSANAAASRAHEARAQAEQAKTEASAIERSMATSVALWDTACDLAGTTLDRTAATPDAVGVLRRKAVDLASDPARLDREEKLLTDWVERLEEGGSVGRELTQEFHRQANVVGVTCAHAGKKAFYESHGEYDVVIIDEVSKATPTELLLPALLGRRVILVGDHRQLPPIFGQESSFEEAAAELAIETDTLRDALQASLFKERYEHLAAVAPASGDGAAADAPRAVMLTTQYRMHSHIMVGVNQFYDDHLQLGHLSVDGRVVPLDEHRAHDLACSPWLSPDDHLVWIDTPTGGEWGHTQDGTTRFNVREVDVVGRLITALSASGSPHLDIGVTSVYASQVRKLRSAVDRLNLPAEVFGRLRVSTVDKFQGMERDIMIVSLVLNGQGHRPSGFLRTPERVNVAMSRARRLLVIVGSSYNYCELTGAESPYARFYDVAQTQGRIVNASLVLHA